MKTHYPCPDFHLDSDERLGSILLKENIYTFHEALQFVHNLPYRRISDIDNLELLVKEKTGTCSSKHAFLAALALENGNNSIKLKLGYFKFYSTTLPKLKNEFEKLHLEYLIEAHVYLSYNKKNIDVTSKSFDARKLLPSESLIEELTLTPDQAGQYKQNLHKNYFKKWCEKSGYNFESLWALRLEVIANLAEINKFCGA